MDHGYCLFMPATQTASTADLFISAFDAAGFQRDCNGFLAREWNDIAAMLSPYLRIPLIGNAIYCYPINRHSDELVLACIDACHKAAALLLTFEHGNNIDDLRAGLFLAADQCRYEMARRAKRVAA